MFLKQLTIEHNNQVVRVVNFHMGLNLIVDETSSTNKAASGNNVGKTTLLRVIDYCLGGDLERIYKDKETKTSNEKVKNFLQDGNTKLTLELENQDKKIKIVRINNFPPTINGEEKVTTFEHEIGEILFKLSSNKPSVRQLIKKFLRIDSNQLDNIYKFLPVFSSSADYENVFLYLFGFTDHQVLREKADLNNSLKKLTNRKKALGTLKLGTLKQIIKALDNDLKALEKKIEKFEVGDAVKSEVANLEKTRAEMSEVSLELGDVNTRIQLSSQTLENLKKTKANIDTSLIKDLYEQAGLLLEHVSKKFEEVLGFHNAMVENKLLFVTASVENLTLRKVKLEEKIEQVSLIEQKLLQSISKTGALDDLQKINQQIYVLKEQRGQKTALLTEVEDVEKKIKAVTDSLDLTKQTVKLFEERLEENIFLFNESYRTFSKKLYDEEYIFTCNKDEEGNYEFGITSMQGGAIGAGKKKGQIAAFDLAYLKYLEKKNAKTCRFQMNDRLEEIHLNQLKEVFEIADSIKGQFIVPILRERISGLGEEFINKHLIVSLSQEDKLFRIKD